MNKTKTGVLLKQRLMTGVSAIGVKIAVVGAAGALVLGVPHAALAFNLYDQPVGSNTLEINLDTVLSYQTFLRVQRPSHILTGPANANGSEGDLNFQHGIVSNEFQATPTFDLKYGDYGAHVSGEFYVNTSYLGTNQNDQPGTLNPYSIAKSNDFTSATRNVNGLDARLLDAFVYGSQRFGADDSQSFALKVGRQTLLWGQSLFFAGNGIAAGQAPDDAISAQNLPNPETQQEILPVGQVVATYQPNDSITLQGYYQFEWEPTNIEGVGSYFSSTDVLDKGGQRIIGGNTGPAFGNQNLYFFRTKGLTPPIDDGQFGLSLQGQIGALDLGVYGLRYDAKTPEVYLAPTGSFAPTPNGLSIGNYFLVYPRDIQIYGASISSNIGDANVAAEVSGRRNMPLVSNSLISTPLNPGNASSDPLYAVGSTIAAQASTIYVSPGVPLDPGGVTITAEIAGNHVLSVDKNKAALASGRNATAAQLEFVLTPTYYEVIPNLTVTFPIGVTYNFLGRSEIDSTENHGTGAFTFGITGVYRAVWTASLTYKDYLGRPDTVLNTSADRSYVSFNIQRSF